jgi:hypothetical protein
MSAVAYRHENHVGVVAAPKWINRFGFTIRPARTDVGDIAECVSAEGLVSSRSVATGSLVPSCPACIACTSQQSTAARESAQSGGKWMERQSST